MILLTTLCDDYIDRPKLTEQKLSFECIVRAPPPTKVGRNDKKIRKTMRLVVCAYVESY